mgnify:CR=1 FL=1
MAKKIKIGKITKKDILKMERKARREEDIDNRRNVTHNRVHKSKKQYKRKPKHENKDNNL